MADIRRKLVIVGDGACGKVLSPPWFFVLHLLNGPLIQTCLLIVFSKGTFPEVIKSLL